MTFVAALNGLWVVLGLVALVSTIHTVWARKQSIRSARNWLLIVGVGLIVAALFPYISATDDVLRIDHDQTRQLPGHSHTQQTDNLLRLYEAMEISVVSPILPVTVHFTFLAFVGVLAVAATVAIAPAVAGRSPPSF